MPPDRDLRAFEVVARLGSMPSAATQGMGIALDSEVFMQDELRRREQAPRRLSRLMLAVVLLVLGVATIGDARAAGGHHAVDDAAVLDPGQCLLETWLERERAAARTLLHGGVSCRVGAVELNPFTERQAADDSPTTQVTGFQTKWSTEIGAGWSAGLVAAVAARNRSSRAGFSTLVVPVTWQPVESLAVHANAGRDFRTEAPARRRAGVAVEWSPLPTGMLVAERWNEAGDHLHRLAVRWAPDPSLNLDLGFARGLGGSVPTFWTVGVTWFFAR